MQLIRILGTFCSEPLQRPQSPKAVRADSTYEHNSKKEKQKMKTILKNQKGQGALEYGIVALVILAVVIAAMRTPLNTALSNMFNKVNTTANNIS